jgi:release factor glutamine methyltransferase
VNRAYVNRASVVDRLVAAGCVAAEDEARQFLAAAPDDATLDAWLRRREAGEPPAWITGATDFAGCRVRVDPGVYVPRPQTEVLVRRAAAVLPARGRAVDLCTGSGAVAVGLAAAVPGATVIGVELDPAAARCARRNGVPVLVGDGADALGGDGSFDVVTAVAPYVPTDAIEYLPADVRRYEPRSALDGGDDGLDLVRRVIVDAARLLRTRGWLFVEVGGTQDDALAAHLTTHGFAPVDQWRDADGDLRGIAARASGRDR